MKINEGLGIQIFEIILRLINLSGNALLLNYLEYSKMENHLMKSDISKT